MYCICNKDGVYTSGMWRARWVPAPFLVLIRYVHSPLCLVSSLFTLAARTNSMFPPMRNAQHVTLSNFRVINNLLTYTRRSEISVRQVVCIYHVPSIFTVFFCTARLIDEQFSTNLYRTSTVFSNNIPHALRVYRILFDPLIVLYQLHTFTIPIPALQTTLNVHQFAGAYRLNASCSFEPPAPRSQFPLANWTAFGSSIRTSREMHNTNPPPTSAHRPLRQASTRLKRVNSSTCYFFANTAVVRMDINTLLCDDDRDYDNEDLSHNAYDTLRTVNPNELYHRTFSCTHTPSQSDLQDFLLSE